MIKCFVEEGATGPEKEILKEETAKKDGSAAETGKELRCMRRFAAIAAKDAKSLSGQAETGLFIAPNVLQTIKRVKLRTDR